VKWRLFSFPIRTAKFGSSASNDTNKCYAALTCEIKLKWTLKQFQSCFRLTSIFILVLKNSHEANLFKPITLRRLGAWSLAVTAITAAAIVTSYKATRPATSIGFPFLTFLSSFYRRLPFYGLFPLDYFVKLTRAAIRLIFGTLHRLNRLFLRIFCSFLRYPIYRPCSA